MAWVRIHDGAMSHPKVIGMFDWRDPFHVWVWGMSYCQSHLTDGFVTNAAVPRMGRKAVDELVARHLWETAEGGWRVHDYLDWNDSRDVVTTKRTEARERMAAARRRVPVNVRANEQLNISRTSPEVLRGLGKGSSSVRSLEREFERKPSADSKWPVFKGNRLVVFEWMLTKMQATLGQHADAIEWDIWLNDADRRAMAEPVVAEDWWPWLQAELLAYAGRQGWSVAVQQAGKQTLAARMAAVVAKVKAEA